MHKLRIKEVISLASIATFVINGPFGNPSVITKYGELRDVKSLAVCSKRDNVRNYVIGSCTKKSYRHSGN